MREQDRVGVASDRRADDVRDGDDLRPHLLREADRRERVGGLAGLGDADHQRVLVQDRIAVAELRREIELDRDARPVLDRVLRSHPRVERRPAGDDDDLVDRSQGLGAPVDLVERTMRPASSIRPRIVLRTASGCSKISFSMKSS